MKQKILTCNDDVVVPEDLERDNLPHKEEVTAWVLFELLTREGIA